MKKLCILAVLIAAMSMSGFSGVVMAENSVLIENGDFENGISGFGICYSGKEDTVMPSLRESKLLSKEGGALEFVPGANLSSAASNSPASLGFAYQGVFNKSLLDLKQGVKYSVSADIYPAVNDIKMRFVLVSNNRAVAASDEFDVPADKWNSLTFSYVPEEDIENAKVRIAFYNIKYGKSVYVDNLSCSEAIVSNSMWEAVSDEDITIEDGALSFTTAEGTESGIEAVTDSGKYINGETYGLTATVSTTADKAYVSFAVGAEHADYIIKQGDSVKILLPFEAKAGVDNKLIISALTEDAAAVTLTNLEVVDKYSVINVKEADGNIVVSGVLRGGNEREEISVQIGDIETVQPTVLADGSYSASTAIPEMSEAKKVVRITVSDILGYDEVGGSIYTDYILLNPDYADSVATQVSGKTAAQVKAVLTEEVMDNLGVSVIPAFKTADKDDVYAYLSDKTIADGEELIDEIKLASALSSLNDKKQTLSGMTDEYAELLKADEVSAYTDIYAKADKDTLNNMFKQCTADIEDIDSYKYALCETLVRYDMQSKVNYSQQLELLKKYDEELDLDFTEYNKLESVKQYSVAAEWLKDIRTTTDYSGLQASLDELVEEAKKNKPTTSPGLGLGGGGGGGGGVGIKTDALVQEPVTETAPAEEYEFGDLAEHKWAENSIYALVEKGVISKPDDKKFNPENNVTRAEMAKMTAILFDIDEYSGNEVKFNDVSADSWYYKYVMALFENEVVKGISDTEFGSDMPITRQDICVIFARLLNEKSTESAEVFADIDDASDYAKDAIKLMKELGIISGYEDGTFRPNGYATRAEISQILYNISNR